MNEEEDEYHLGRTYRSKSGTRRITYRPDWSKATPWASYRGGSAGQHFATVEQAQIYHRDKGDPLIVKED